MDEEKARKLRQIVRDAYNDDVHVEDDAAPDEIVCDDTGDTLGYWVPCEMWVHAEELGEPHNKVA